MDGFNDRVGKEEEDEYDKIAAGTQNAGGPLLYMKDVTHHAPFLNSHNVLQHHTHNNNDDQPMFNAPPQPLLDHARKFKSILKRKREDLEKPSPKRVRFDPTCKEHDASQLDGFPVPQVSKNQPGVPDYLLNPSKYTRYTFNDDDDDKRSNTEAYMEFLEQIKKSKDVGLEQKPSAADLPASVVFIPRKKRGDAAPSTSDGQVKESSTGVGISIAAVEVQQDEVSDMLQDEPDVDAVCAKPPKFQKPSRQYRSKVEDDDSVS
ncbi:hypothetical protein CTI12_AA119010 [Artemisia annua]|uniref:Uncharacterized protein n=1 Tax=Artemisia annua TaxID=35608 RepID=A0A2U1PRT4_ARTAN|nr:hypothetical protein CTI12_AA119010 [Artemisia annua]